MGQGNDTPVAGGTPATSFEVADGAPPSPFAPPVKRSVTIAGHQTAISLEPIFWDALRAAATARALPINALIAQIDVLRMAAPDPPNLASAIRCWLYDAQRARDDKNVLQ